MQQVAKGQEKLGKKFSKVRKSLEISLWMRKNSGKNEIFSLHKLIYLVLALFTTWKMPLSHIYFVQLQAYRYNPNDMLPLLIEVLILSVVFVSPSKSGALLKIFDKTYLGQLFSNMQSFLITTITNTVSNMGNLWYYLQK